MSAVVGETLPVPVGGGDVVAFSRDVLARHARSFRWGALVLPADRRDDAAVVYAFCREVDDAVDECPDPAQAAAAVERLRAELTGGATPRPVVGAFLDVAARRGIDVAHALELVTGVASDLGEVRFADDGELIRYGYRVAGTVGLMMCGVIGVTDPRATPFAIDLGVGMQLTNICRDVLEDGRRGRVYLPADRLRARGMDPETLVAGTPDAAALRAVVADLLALAERFYDSADEGMRFIPWRSRAAIVLVGRLYREIGRKLLREGGDPLRGRTIVSPLTKLGWLARLPTELGGRVVSGRSPLATHDASLHRALAGLPGANPLA